HPHRHPLFLAIAAALAVCLAVAALLNRQMSADRGAMSEPPPRLSLVVLPFQNLSGDPRDDHLADSITDDLTTDLSLIPGALIVARQSAYTFKARPTDVRQIGRELRVRYALEGSIRRIGDTLRVNVQLISSETGTQLWSDRFDEGISQLAVGQEEITTR